MYHAAWEGRGVMGGRMEGRETQEGGGRAVMGEGGSSEGVVERHRLVIWDYL